MYARVAAGKGCAFVQYQYRQHAELAMEQLQGMLCGNVPWIRSLLVVLATSCHALPGNNRMKIAWGRSTSKAPAPAAQPAYGGYSGYYQQYPYAANPVGSPNVALGGLGVAVSPPPLFLFLFCSTRPLGSMRIHMVQSNQCQSQFPFPPLLKKNKLSKCKIGNLLSHVSSFLISLCWYVPSDIHRLIRSFPAAYRSAYPQLGGLR